MSYRLKIKEFDEVKLKTQNWTDENVAKLVKKKQKQQLAQIINDLAVYRYVGLNKYLEKRLKELK